jgi:hypothetical protein
LAFDLIRNRISPEVAVILFERTSQIDAYGKSALPEHGEDDDPVDD